MLKLKICKHEWKGKCSHKGIPKTTIKILSAWFILFGLTELSVCCYCMLASFPDTYQSELTESTFFYAIFTFFVLQSIAFILLGLNGFCISFPKFAVHNRRVRLFAVAAHLTFGWTIAQAFLLVPLTVYWFCLKLMSVLANQHEECFISRPPFQRKRFKSYLWSQRNKKFGLEPTTMGDLIFLSIFLL